MLHDSATETPAQVQCLAKLYGLCNWYAAALHIHQGGSTPPRIVLAVAGRDLTDSGISPLLACAFLAKACATVSSARVTGAAVRYDFPAHPAPADHDLRRCGAIRGMWSPSGGMVLIYSDDAHDLRVQFRGRDDHVVKLLGLLHEHLDKIVGA